MVFFTRLIVLLAAVLLNGCERPDAPPLDQQLYVWQRQWTPAHEAALRDSHADFSTLRVLALQAFPQAGWSRARIDPVLLKRDGRPLIAVIRLDGQLKRLDQDEVTAHIQQVLSDWQGQGLILSGVEIDHDAGNARLPAYREFLTHLRAVLPASLPLSITALPAWLDSPELPALLAAVDSSVLQVHAVSDPRRGLFDPDQARQWAKAWSRITSKPFYLALPAYGVALLSGTGGAPVVESEVSIDRGGDRRELLADPLQLSKLGAELRADPPAHLAGLIWFRLPLANDRRAWSLTTLIAVARGDMLDSRVGLKLSAQDGLYDISVSNQGNLDSAWPERLTLAVQGCDGADALAGYALQQRPDLLTFTRLREGRIPAGGQRAIGWARCANIDQGGSNVHP
ncbi:MULTISPECIES: DUF3142 domain-containing protein [Gammaproteobacteria]|uniref:DUF3142 domain-containing protein n=1 Tax=Gammaproteobacteria TaxID=1236 RepID=UPI001911B029|nr:MULTISPECIES: DUF3142 domain-containing protein [Gammaproteobacteria]MBK5302518.1 DUF3142 domain-containing protein [Bacillus sp. TH86]MBK5322287.1 DUF3142 domain-containing protein [Bacillus sp. TH59]MBK5337237.1 DUF3142 domain-containing protein [Bacillus sp. TH57]MBK5311296.1 DUF3142 domain-containing protein [Pseudomonas sp. TH71]MBK5316784.1 DUF3142 domain-containing protein [Erwinia sp. TH79]